MSKQYLYTALLSISMLCMSCASRELGKKPGIKMQQVKFNNVSSTIEVDVNFLLYFPENYDESKKWPLLIFLHGRGERGDDLDRVKMHGPPKHIEQGRDYPFIVAAPQCRENKRWSVAILDNWLTYLLTLLPVNEKRIYLTGLSMGGFGTWAWAAERLDRFAAIAPICGGGEIRNVELLRDMPIWTFHGARDPVISISRTQEMVDALQAIGSNIKFTVYPEATHNSWTETYNNPLLLDWFLQHHK